MQSKLRHSGQIGHSFAGAGDFSWSSYWTQQFKKLFTGVPIAYDGNPLYVTDISMSRCMVIVNGVYHLFEERSGSNPNWWIRKRTSTDGLKFTNFTAPLFLPGGAGTYDVNGQADPTVIYDGVGDWKM
jgi:hypothetical protein